MAFEQLVIRLGSNSMNIMRFAVVAVLVCCLASASSAEIMVTMSDPVPLEDTGLVQIQVSAVGTNGDVVATIDNPHLTGNVHQVTGPDFGTGGAPAPTSNQHAAPYPLDWVAYDSFFKLPAQALGALGTITESPVTGSTSDIGLLPFSGVFHGQAGFGDIHGGSGANRWAFTLAPENRSSEYNFLQVVTTPGTAVLDIDIIGVSATGQPLPTVQVRDLMIGGGNVPEPGTFALAGLAVAGVVSFARRRLC